MLLTLVDPHRGFEVAYNRWYERDHFYAGCMIGPYLFAGSRWVATRELKDAPLADRRGDDREARPTRARTSRSTSSSAAITTTTSTIGRGTQVNALYADGRGFAERRHIHTVLFDHLGAQYRDEDPVPIELALDHGYDGDRPVWFDGIDRDAAALHASSRRGHCPICSRAPTSRSRARGRRRPGENEPRNVPMDLGSKAGGPERLLQMCFVQGDVRDALPAAAQPTRTPSAAAGLATTRLVAPFFRTRRRHRHLRRRPLVTAARLCEWRVVVAMRICARGCGCRGVLVLVCGVAFLATR